MNNSIFGYCQTHIANNGIEIINTSGGGYSYIKLHFDSNGVPTIDMFHNGTLKSKSWNNW